MKTTESARPGVTSTETGMSTNTVGIMCNAQGNNITFPADLQGRLALRPRELAKVLGIGANRAYELCNRADFPAVHVSGNTIVIPVDALRRWLDQQAEREAAI